MTVRIPSALQSYTGRARAVETDGAAVADALHALDRLYPGIRFRIIDEQNGIRQHIKLFINHDQVRDLSSPLQPDDTLHIICALSGG